METFVFRTVTIKADVVSETDKRQAVKDWLYQQKQLALPLDLIAITEAEIDQALADWQAEQATRETIKQSKVDLRNVPSWGTWTAKEATTYIDTILSGQTPDQVETWARANVTNQAGILNAIILLGKELARLRDICEKQAQMIVYLRDSQ